MEGYRPRHLDFQNFAKNKNPMNFSNTINNFAPDFADILMTHILERIRSLILYISVGKTVPPQLHSCEFHLNVFLSARYIHRMKISSTLQSIN